MRGRKVLGWNLVSKSEAPFQRRAADYNEEINSKQIVPMKLRIFLLLVAFHVLAVSLVGQTAPPASTPAALRALVTYQVLINGSDARSHTFWPNGWAIPWYFGLFRHINLCRACSPRVSSRGAGRTNSGATGKSS